MATVKDLRPGDVVDAGNESATFVARTDHPLFGGLQLVVWRLADGRWSHDALHLTQDVGHVRRATIEQRRAALQEALLS